MASSSHAAASPAPVGRSAAARPGEPVIYLTCASWNIGLLYTWGWPRVLKVGEGIGTIFTGEKFDPDSSPGGRAPMANISFHMDQGDHKGWGKCQQVAWDHAIKTQLPQDRRYVSSNNGSYQLVAEEGLMRFKDPPIERVKVFSDDTQFPAQKVSWRTIAIVDFDVDVQTAKQNGLLSERGCPTGQMAPYAPVSAVVMHAVNGKGDHSLKGNQGEAIKSHSIKRAVQCCEQRGRSHGNMVL